MLTQYAKAGISTCSSSTNRPPSSKHFPLIKALTSAHLVHLIRPAPAVDGDKQHLLLENVDFRSIQSQHSVTSVTEFIRARYSQYGGRVTR